MPVDDRSQCLTSQFSCATQYQAPDLDNLAATLLPVEEAKISIKPK